MKLALLGDVHGNHLALRAVLSAATRHGVEGLLVTGDLVGYYSWPKEVLEMLAPWSLHVVRGNHEVMLAPARQDPGYLRRIDEKYGNGLRVALDSLVPAQLHWLENLPHPLRLELGGCQILLCHGAPWDMDCYIYPDAAVSLLERCASEGADIVILGHTHHAFQARCGRTLVVNPGSVGQPRDRQPGAAWALLDTATREVTPFRENYDIAQVVAHARLAQPAVPYLAEVLCRI
jgi:putative phosphoesterase